MGFVSNKKMLLHHKNGYSHFHTITKFTFTLISICCISFISFQFSCFGKRYSTVKRLDKRLYTFLLIVFEFFCSLLQVVLPRSSDWFWTLKWDLILWFFTPCTDWYVTVDHRCHSDTSNSFIVSECLLYLDNHRYHSS